MLTGNTDKTDAESTLISQLLEARSNLQVQMDEMTEGINATTALSDKATIRLAAVHRNYNRAKKRLDEAKTKAAADAVREADIYYADDTRETAGILAIGGAALLTILTGGLGAPTLVGAIGGGAAGIAVYSEDREAERKRRLKSKTADIDGKQGKTVATHSARLKQLEADKQQLLATIQTDEQKRLYFGVVAEILLDNGIKIARQLNQYAHFNGISADDVFAMEDKELQAILDRMLKGQPKATDVERLVGISEQLSGKHVVTPEIRALKQFINHVVIPNKLYFDILASYADDIRDKDLSTFPPLEILGDKPISLSGKIEFPKTEADKKEESEEMLKRQAAKVAIRNRIAADAAYTILRESDQPHLEKMAALEAANNAEIGQYSDVFQGIEKAVSLLEARREELEGKSGKLTLEIEDGTKKNSQIDQRIHETRSRNQAKQKAATISSRVRGGLALASGVVLALFDGGTVSGPMAAAGASSLFTRVGSAMRRGAKDSLHSITYSIGQEINTRVENSALDDYMFSLQQQKVDLPALRTELEGVQKAIAETQASKEFQDILNDEAKRSHVAETLLLRSLIRNGVNNSQEMAELCEQTNVASLDEFLTHYEGTRLGLALKKHCHGLADSNDIHVILAEADTLRGSISWHDQVLKSYVEEVLKPNIGAFFSKASKMDVISQNNLTGFGNELHFSAEMQLETSRAVRILLSNEFGMSVVGREDVRNMFDFWLHRHGDDRLYDEKIRDGEMSDEYPEKRVSHVDKDRMRRFVDMAKRSVASGRTSFPKVGDMFTRVCAYEYFLPQAVHVGGKDNIFTDYPESPSAYPMVNEVVGEFIKQMSFADLNDYRDRVGTRLDNVIAQSFIDFFAEIGNEHGQNEKLAGIRQRLNEAANYDDYGPVFDRYARNITKDALGRFDQFLGIYATNLEAQLRVSTEEDRSVIEEQLDKVKELADGKLNPRITRPGTHEARLLAHDESHTGENMAMRG